MTAPLPSDSEGRIQVGAKDRLSELADEATAMACGPVWVVRSAQRSGLLDVRGPTTARGVRRRRLVRTGAACRTARRIERPSDPDASSG